MMAQMFGRATGLSKGRDSALHSGVSELGIFGNTSMLGANLPVAAGLAYTYKMEATDNVVVAYFGEGASNVGDFHEALSCGRASAGSSSARITSPRHWFVENGDHDVADRAQLRLTRGDNGTTVAVSSRRCAGPRQAAKGRR